MLTNSSKNEWEGKYCGLTKYIDDSNLDALDLEGVRCPYGAADNTDEQAVPAEGFHPLDPLDLCHLSGTEDHLEVTGEGHTRDHESEQLAKHAHY